jgi:hypothetical protein
MYVGPMVYPNPLNLRQLLDFWIPEKTEYLPEIPYKFSQYFSIAERWVIDR